MPTGAFAIDVGCGVGEEAAELASRVGVRVHGIDPVARNVEQASALAANRGLSDREAREFWELHLGYGQARSVRPSDIEAAIANAGLRLAERIDFGAEWGEYAQERSGAGGRRLVHAARLLRDPLRYTQRFGESAYRIMLGDCLWHVYRMIGKLHGAAFIFARPD